jgi:hypothetical protein
MYYEMNKDTSPIDYETHSQISFIAFCRLHTKFPNRKRNNGNKNVCVGVECVGVEKVEIGWNPRVELVGVEWSPYLSQEGNSHQDQAKCHCKTHCKVRV